MKSPAIVVGVGDAVGLFGAHGGQVAGEDQQGGPIESDLEAPPPGGQLEQIDSAPDEPGDKP